MDEYGPTAVGKKGWEMGQDPSSPIAWGQWLEGDFTLPAAVPISLGKALEITWLPRDLISLTSPASFRCVPQNLQGCLHSSLIKQGQVFCFSLPL